MHRLSVHFIDLRVLPRLVVGQGTGAKQRGEEKGIKFVFHEYIYLSDEMRVTSYKMQVLCDVIA